MLHSDSAGVIFSDISSYNLLSVSRNIMAMRHSLKRFDNWHISRNAFVWNNILYIYDSGIKQEDKQSTDN